MALLLAAEPLPLHADPDGVVRIGGTRVTLDTVVAAYQAGASAEEIWEDYPVLRLGEVYRAIAFFLEHRSEVGAYLKGRRDQARRVRREVEAQQGSQVGLRERLAARPISLVEFMRRSPWVGVELGLERDRSLARPLRRR